jgi:MFS family permease
VPVKGADGLRTGRDALRTAAHRLHRAAAADGADRSGLTALIGTHALQAAGDALVAIALANTTFFAVNVGQARGKIALYLLLTLLPFSLLIPVGGPLLDKFPHGRRNVLALTTGGRGLVAWTLAGSVTSLALYPQALLILIGQRAYAVARQAAVVRVRPPSLGLVASNARLNVASLASGGIAAAVGVGVASTLGTDWVLRLCAVVYIVAAVTSLRLPGHVDDSAPKDEVEHERFTMRHAHASIQRALVGTMALRAISGLLTLGLAILLKAHHTAAWTIALVLGAAVVGGLSGTALASRLPSERTARLTAIALLAPMAACLLAAISGTTLFRVIAVGCVGLGASLGKYALDAAIQSHVPDYHYGAAFARSETALQLSWAGGGALGLALSLLDDTPLGQTGSIAIIFAMASAVPLLGLYVSWRWKHTSVPVREKPSRS